MDIFPTLYVFFFLPMLKFILIQKRLNIAGIPPVKDIVIDGIDVTDALLGSGSSPHQYLYFWNGKPGT